MKHCKPNIIIAGDEIFAGIDADDVMPISLALVVQFPDAVSFARSIATGVIDADVFATPPDNPKENEVNLPVARKIVVAAESVECPSCHYIVYGLFLGNPRGKLCECNHCSVEFAIANDAVMELR